MKEQEIQILIENAINAKFTSLLFDNKNQTPFHVHSGADGTPKIDPVNLLPFTVYSTVPTDTATNGTMRLVFDGTNYRLYFRINNAWKYATLA